MTSHPVRAWPMSAHGPGIQKHLAETEVRLKMELRKENMPGRKSRLMTDLPVCACHCIEEDRLNSSLKIDGKYLLNVLHLEQAEGLNSASYSKLQHHTHIT